MHPRQTEFNKSSEVELVQVHPTAPSDYTFTPQENYRNFECNGKLYSSVWPQKIELLSQSEQEELKNAPWFQVGLPREISLEILLQQMPGSFLVRQSESYKKCFALSMRVAPLEPPKLSHYLIEKTNRGYRFKGYTKEFSSLKSLVIHHAFLKEQLPTQLIIPRAQGMTISNLIVYETTRSEDVHVKSPTTTLCFSRRSKEK